MGHLPNLTQALRFLEVLRLKGFPNLRDGLALVCDDERAETRRRDNVEIVHHASSFEMRMVGHRKVAFWRGFWNPVLCHTTLYAFKGCGCLVPTDSP